MGIGKKITEPLRVVSIYDDAIDWTQTNKLEYIESRNEELLVFLPDGKPTFFTLSPLPPSILAMVTSRTDEKSKMFAFQFGVTDCDDPNIGLRWDRKEKYPLIEPSSLESIPVKIWREIGSLVIQREEFSEGEEPRFAL